MKGIDGIYIDSNLLVLLVLGEVDVRLVGKHPLVRQFTPFGLATLWRFIESIPKVFLTPNTLTETSNLLGKSKEFRSVLRAVIGLDKGQETFVRSQVAANNRKFIDVGLTDAALLESASSTRPLITADFDLYGMATAKGDGVAYNFMHFQTGSISFADMGLS